VVGGGENCRHAQTLHDSIGFVVPAPRNFVKRRIDVHIGRSYCDAATLPQYRI
jgi:hypothetical protein